MTEFDGEIYRPTIDAILSVADLEKVSVKRIRRALQELFVVDFEEDKKPINDFILERYHWLVDQRERDEKKKMEDDDARLAAQLQNEDSRGGRRRAAPSAGPASTPKKQKKKRATPTGTSSISTLELNLSDKLSEFLGVSKLPRTQVVKQVWDYIKAHDLQNPSDRREIICDDKMIPIFGNKVTMFSMNKVLAKHMWKDEEE